MQRIIIIIVIILIVGGVSYTSWQYYQSTPSDSTLEILRESEITLGNLTETVNAVGSVKPEASVSLNFGMGGTIQDIYVTRGQMVEGGEVLATLDGGELSLAVQQAKDALLIQQLTLQSRLNYKPSQATLDTALADIEVAEAQHTVAEANLEGAKAALSQAEAQKAQLLNGPSPGAIAAAELQVSQALLEQTIAEYNHNSSLNCITIELPSGESQETCPTLGTIEEQTRAAWENSIAAVAAANAQLADLLAEPRWTDLQIADASIANAEANVLAMQGNVSTAKANILRAQAAYDRLLEPVPTEEISILEAQVAAMETNLEMAQLRFEQATVKAPISGRVANVLLNPGEHVVAGTPVITIVDETAFHLVVNVDEIDIDRIIVGQQANISFDALPDMPITGHVSDISPTSAGTSSVVTYPVTINITDNDDLDLRTDMSASVSVIVDEIDNVLLVENWAVRFDRTTGEAFVMVKRSDLEIEEVLVETGLRNERFSEVISGLQEGDVVVLANEREEFRLFGGNNE